ncbi:MAG: bacteriohemerythrin [Anaerolineaceae bacterium]|nr:bacteriohemerythrin [Anaerolineaceae bacterium]
MPFIIWNSTFSVGVKEMDKQHQIMIEIINHLYDLLIKSKGDRELNKVLNEMIGYTNFHFSSEENLLSTKGYPEYYRQKKEHDTFLQKTLEFQRDFQKGKMALSLEVLQFLKVWWTQHIKIEDKKYTEFISNLN